MQPIKDNASIKEYQDYIKALCKEKWWDWNSLVEIFLLFSEEVWELAKAIRYKNNFHVEEHKKKSIDLEGEFADVFSYLLDLANVCNIDLESAFKKKIDEINQREWN